MASNWPFRQEIVQPYSWTKATPRLKKGSESKINLKTVRWDGSKTTGPLQQNEHVRLYPFGGALNRFVYHTAGLSYEKWKLRQKSTETMEAIDFGTEKCNTFFKRCL